ncbi:alpha-2B adrenergic receptor-like [Montipora capricornis]|uniref:alpha-2B adrenergic receptor-like n=1 Tax=Montipora capricornis TaxID=246305 RepID=UPI0035F19286
MTRLVRRSSATSGGIHHLIFLSTFGVFLCIFTYLGNALILVALRKESTLGSPSKLLLRSLETSDFCVGMLSDPLTAISLVSAIKEHWSELCYCAFSTTAVINSALCTVSLLTTSAMSVNRLLASSLGMRYSETVTTKPLHSIRGELSQTLVLSHQYAGVYVLVNSSLNPLLYCWKFLEVRQAVVATLKKWRCSST